MATSTGEESPDIYHIPLPSSEDWKLTDFYEFPHTYQQCYSFVYCLDTDLPERDRARIDLAFEKYPWRGGYSYVNIYQVMTNQLPPGARPKVKSIHKASPGWIDLALNMEAAVVLATQVATIAASLAGATASYVWAIKLIASISSIRKRAQLADISLTAQQLRAVNAASDELAKAMGFESLAALHLRTGNPEVSLKLLCAHFRRMDTLVEYVRTGKVVLPQVPMILSDGDEDDL